MNIWKWVEEVQDELVRQGHHRLAELMRVLPSYTENENHAQLDAIVPEALALARAIKNPWIEIFIRHWNLQSKVLDRYEVSKMLPEAVNLLELAHRDNTRDCPQSICVVQDISICYGLADGPGYVEERLAVGKETLAKIDATWPCFVCISAEYIDTLLDGGQYEEALTFLEQQKQALLLAGQHEKLEGSRIEVLIRLKRYEEAYALNKSYYSPDDDKDDLLTQAIDEARISAYLGRYEEANRVLPDFTQIAQNPDHYLSWAEAVRLLAKATVIPNDWHLSAKFQQLSDNLSHNGVIRQAFTIILWQAELALKRGHPNTASRCCSRAEALIPRLRKPLDAPHLLEEMRADIATAQQERRESESSVDKRGLYVYLEEPDHVIKLLGDEPEFDIDVLDNALKIWPEDEFLLMSAAEAYEKLGEVQHSLEILSQYLETYPDSPGAVSMYGSLLFENGQREIVQNFARGLLKRNLSEEVHDCCHFLLASQYEKDGEFELAKPHLYALLETEPHELLSGTRKKLAEMERQTGNLEAALQHLDWLVEMKEERGHYDWERMVVATLLEDWDKVRQSAERVGFKALPRDGPIVQEMGTCRIQFREADGEQVIYYAMQTGPVTARIVEIAAPNSIQHYGDSVVFDPVKLNKPKKDDDEEAEQDNQYPLFASIQVTQTGGYTSYSLEGVHPGKKQLRHLKNALECLGCKCQVQSDEDYQLYLGDDSEPMPGLYAYLAVPETQALQEVADLLAITTQNYAHPLNWSDLVEKIGDKNELERQRGIEEEYGL
jgi:tetratricopeptide (TPR) repeat protein